MTNKHMKDAVSLLIRKMQIKTPRCYYCVPTKWTKMEKSANNILNEDVVQWELSYTIDGNVNLNNHSGKPFCIT